MNEIEKLKAGLSQAAVPAVVPFGKYRGQPVEVMRRDTSYLDWLSMQEGIRQRYPWIFNIQVAEPTETPEHNRYQMLFFDPEFAEDFFDAFAPGYREKSARDMADYRPEKHGERKRSCDFIGPVVLSKLRVEAEVAIYYNNIGHPVSGPGPGIRKSGVADISLRLVNEYWTFLRVEIKPVMGDDYPAVLRQMKDSLCNALYLVQYTGEGASLSQVKEMFSASGIRVLMHADFWMD